MPVVIRSLREGFRRAGVAHSVAPVEHPDGAFTPEQLATLRAEPMLMVEVVEAAADAGPEAAIDALIAETPAGDFAKDGVPRLAALNARLKAAGLGPIDAAARDAALARLEATGWRPPAAPDA